MTDDQKNLQQQPQLVVMNLVNKMMQKRDEGQGITSIIDSNHMIEKQAIEILTEELWTAYVDCLDIDTFAESLEISDVNDLFNS